MTLKNSAGPCPAASLFVNGYRDVDGAGPVIGIDKSPFIDRHVEKTDRGTGRNERETDPLPALDSINRLNNILTAVNGYVDLCIGKTDRDDPRAYFLQKIKGLSKEAAETIRQNMPVKKTALPGGTNRRNAPSSGND
jgi:hypothetical protein